MKSEPPTIAILTHPIDDFAQTRYLIRLMIPRWEAMGFRVAVVTGPNDSVPADIAVMHVDLTVVPDSCRRLAERYPVVLNRLVVDIRKRVYSSLLLRRDEGYTGPVIVKTDSNCGGWREFRRDVLESPIGPLLRHRAIGNIAMPRLERIARRLPWRRRRLFRYGYYPVFANTGLVPEGVWENPNLIVERLVSERRGDLYCCRHWLFLGAREVSRRTLSPDPVVKADAQLESNPDPIPQELRDLRRRWAFDYGKFDYGIVDGKVILYDVNRTPGHNADVGRHAQTVEILPEGIRDWLPAA